MSDVSVAKALSSDLSWHILDLLMSSELSALEIANALSAKPSLVKLHLRKLVEAGIVVSKENALPDGKTICIYRPTNDAKAVGFPPRNYQFLSDALIEGLIRSLGEDAARTILRDIGERAGEDTAHLLVSKTEVTKWDAKTYAEHFVKNFMSQMKTYPRIIELGNHHIVYEQANCVFLELGIKRPGLVCDVLDQAVRESIDRKLGANESIRLSCMGHGDPTCKYMIKWNSEPNKSVSNQSSQVKRYAEKRSKL
ncbi:MAG: helix-turn-helix domain-containing protein [Thaumarchaeota archaeon]|nr:helix-turn-helix domain-containing protein [Nitrososphaerota archaeon]